MSAGRAVIRQPWAMPFHRRQWGETRGDEHPVWASRPTDAGSTTGLLISRSTGRARGVVDVLSNHAAPAQCLRAEATETDPDQLQLPAGAVSRHGAGDRPAVTVGGRPGEPLNVTPLATRPRSCRRAQQRRALLDRIRARVRAGTRVARSDHIFDRRSRGRRSDGAGCGVRACSPQRRTGRSASCSARLRQVMGHRFLSMATRASRSPYAPGPIASGAATTSWRPRLPTSCPYRAEGRTLGVVASEMSAQQADPRWARYQ